MVLVGLGSRWVFFFFRHFRVLRHSATPRVPEDCGAQVRLGKAKLPRDVSERVTWSGAFRRLLRSVSPERVGVWTCGLANNWEGVEFHDLVIVALCLFPCLIGFLSAWKRQSLNLGKEVEQT